MAAAASALARVECEFGRGVGRIWFAQISRRALNVVQTREDLTGSLGSLGRILPEQLRNKLGKPI